MWGLQNRLEFLFKDGQRSCAHLLYANWLNYCVYQTSPYNIGDIKKGLRTDD